MLPQKCKIKRLSKHKLLKGLLALITLALITPAVFCVILILKYQTHQHLSQLSLEEMTFGEMTP